MMFLWVSAYFLLAVVFFFGDRPDFFAAIFLAGIFFPAVFFAADFAVVFLAPFAVDLFVAFFAAAAPPGLTRAISLVAMGEPRPVQASQPGPAVKPTGLRVQLVPGVMSLQAA